MNARVAFAPMAMALLAACSSSQDANPLPYDTTGYVSGNDPPDDDATPIDALDDSSRTLPPPAPTAYEGDAPPADVVVIDSTSDVTPTDSTIPPSDTGDLICTDTTFDMNGDPSDGCEVTDTLANHSESSPTKLGVLGACGPYSNQTFTLLFDARMHMPSGAIGAAPLYWSFFEDGSCALGERPTLGLFAVDSASPGSYEIAIYPQGGSPDASCSGSIGAGASLGPSVCSSSVTSRAFVRVRKVSGAVGRAGVTLKVR